MATESPSSQRVLVENDESQLRITTHPSRGGSALSVGIFLSIWLIGWACVEAVALGALLGLLGVPVATVVHVPHPDSGDAFLLGLGVAGLTLIGYATVSVWLTSVVPHN